MSEQDNGTELSAEQEELLAELNSSNEEELIKEFLSEELSQMAQNINEYSENIQELEAKQSSNSFISPTLNILKNLNNNKLPNKDIACAKCKQAMWFKTEFELKCYCNNMATLTYDSSDSMEMIIFCDGKVDEKI